MYRKAKLEIAESKGASCAPAVEVPLEERPACQKVEEEKKEESMDDIIKKL
jgi:hypothetical protein